MENNKDQPQFLFLQTSDQPQFLHLYTSDQPQFLQLHTPDQPQLLLLQAIVAWTFRHGVNGSGKTLLIPSAVFNIKWAASGGHQAHTVPFYDKLPAAVAIYGRAASSASFHVWEVGLPGFSLHVVLNAVACHLWHMCQGLHTPALEAPINAHFLSCKNMCVYFFFLQRPKHFQFVSTRAGPCTA